jgi:spermidine/putrescine transport system substrate-binding protein
MRTRKVLITVAMVVAVSCNGRETQPPAEERPSRVLSVFNWTDYVGNKTIPAFERRVGVKVRYDNYSGNEELVAKLETGGAKYDVVFPSGYAAEILLEKGLLSKLDKSVMENLSYIPEAFASPYFDKMMEYCVPYTWSTTGIGYDSARVGASEANSWDILFDERYKGEILMLDDVRASVGMALVHLGESANSVDPEAVSEARDLLLEQKPLVHVYASGGLPQLFASGEVVVGYGWSGDIRQASKLNPAVRYSVPDGGSLMYVDYMCVPSASEQVTLASEFIDHILDPEVSLEIAEVTAYATTNSGAMELADPELKELWRDLEEWDNGERFEFIRNVGRAIQEYDDAWREVKGAG